MRYPFILNYRHAFHAGNFADVHKHVVLLALLEHLHKKAKPFFILDTHAGRGQYDLQSHEAQRGGEWQAGIGRLATAKSTHPLLRQYSTLVDSTPKGYPGSPLLVAMRLREHDRAVFVEQQPEEAAALSRALSGRRQISVLEQDGYAALRALLPPKENRGLVLIDPPYENESEFAVAEQALLAAVKRWPNGIYALWYPIKPGGAARRLQRSLIASGIKKVLVATLCVRPADSPLGLNGSGMLIINPPWQLDDLLRDVSPLLHRILAPDGLGGVETEWLVGE